MKGPRGLVDDFAHSGRSRRTKDGCSLCHVKSGPAGRGQVAADACREVAQVGIVKERET
jgi:hypothetical protein